VRKLLDIAMTTVGDPALVLLDEPTSGISMDEKFAVMDIVMGALDTIRTTVLFIEHDMEVVERYAPRVIAFYDGRVIADAPTAEALGDPDVRQYVIGRELHRNG
jgi:branched-chain amino acid transport system ATP-binding protein